jgi:hypothetical protein
VSFSSNQIQVGHDVYGSDGDKIGSIAEVQPTYLVIEKGFFFPTDYYIPVSAINTVTNEGVYLTVSKDVALNSGWDTIPDTTATTVLTDDRGWETGPDVMATDVIPTSDAGVVATGVSRQAGYEAISEDELSSRCGKRN